MSQESLFGGEPPSPVSQCRSRRAALAAMQDERHQAQAAEDDAEAERAIRRVGETSRGWIADSIKPAMEVARRLGVFTTDDLWAVLEPAREPRAMGALVTKLLKAGLIVATGGYVRSARPVCHARPIPQYRVCVPPLVIE